MGSCSRHDALLQPLTVARVQRMEPPESPLVLPKVYDQGTALIINHSLLHSHDTMGPSFQLYAHCCLSLDKLLCRTANSMSFSTEMWQRHARVGREDRVSTTCVMGTLILVALVLVLRLL